MYVVWWSAPNRLVHSCVKANTVRCAVILLDRSGSLHGEVCEVYCVQSLCQAQFWTCSDKFAYKSLCHALARPCFCFDVYTCASEMIFFLELSFPTFFFLLELFYTRIMISNINHSSGAADSDNLARLLDKKMTRVLPVIVTIMVYHS